MSWGFWMWLRPLFSDVMGFLDVGKATVLWGHGHSGCGSGCSSMVVE